MQEWASMQCLGYYKCHLPRRKIRPSQLFPSVTLGGWKENESKAVLASLGGIENIIEDYNIII